MQTRCHRTIAAIVAGTLGATTLSGCTVPYNGASSVKRPDGCTVDLSLAGALTPTKDVDASEVGITCPKANLRSSLLLKLQGDFIDKAERPQDLLSLMQVAESVVDARLKSLPDKISESMIIEINHGEGIFPIVWKGVITAAATIIPGLYLADAWKNAEGDTTNNYNGNDINNNAKNVNTPKTTNNNGNRIDVGSYKNNQFKNPYNKDHK